MSAQTRPRQTVSAETLPPQMPAAQALAPQTLVCCPPLHKREPALIKLAVPFRPTATPLSMAEQQQAQQLISVWQQHRLSRYNRYPDPAPAQLPACYILVVLQSGQTIALQQKLTQFATAKATQYSQAEGERYNVVLCHEQHRNISARLHTRVNSNSPTTPAAIAADKLHHALLLANCTAVVTVNSWLGFEALLWQKKVYSFGAAFYTGLGLTRDQTRPQLPGKPVLSVSRAQLVYQLFIRQSQAADIETGQPVNAIDALNWLGLQRQQRGRFAAKLYAIGFNYHWRQSVKTFLQGSNITFVRKSGQVPAGCQAVIWGRTDLSKQLPEDVSLLRLEDGFLRSVGLGAQFVKPLSWVADDTGLYFDATSESALEQLLSQHPLGESLQQRAQHLVQQLVQHGISKYNTGQSQWQQPKTTKKIILVPGQVESDASIKYGAPGIRTNMALLKAVRVANPDAYIIYKPHPDVMAGARAAGAGEQQASQFCDQLAENVNIAVLLNACDEVHVLTSLAGFEALLRGKAVHCYGLPFYAGWELTHDYAVCTRRSRKLNLLQLVAATLLLYPLYVSNCSGYYTTPEHTLQQLLAWRSQPLSWRQKAKNALRLLISKIAGAK